MRKIVSQFFFVLKKFIYLGPTCLVEIWQNLVNRFFFSTKRNFVKKISHSFQIYQYVRAVFLFILTYWYSKSVHPFKSFKANISLSVKCTFSWDTWYVFDSTVPSHCFLLNGSVPSSCFLFNSTVPSTNHYQNGFSIIHEFTLWFFAGYPSSHHTLE